MLHSRKTGKAWPGTLVVLGHLCLALGACAPPVSASLPPSSQQNPLELFQSKEDRIFRLGYRLAAANAEFCDRTAPSLGLLLHDARSYAAPAVVRDNVGLAGDIGVQAVAESSPAALAGLRQNDTLLAIDGTPADTIPVGDRNDWERTQKLAGMIEQSAQDGAVALRWRDADGIERDRSVPSTPVCTSRFELLSGEDGASADGERVLIGEDFPGLAYSNAELAALLAHEMAHNLLGHLPYLEENGRGSGRGRATERDADRLMPWLLANAGFDPAAASGFMRRWGPRHGGGLFRKRSHDGWDERVELIEAELPEIEAATVNGRVDWSIHFRPLLTADK